MSGDAIPRECTYGGCHMIHSPHSIVQAVADVQVALRIESHPPGPIQLRERRLTAVAEKARHACARGGCYAPSHHDFANAVIACIGHVYILVGPNHQALGEVDIE